MKKTKVIIALVGLVLAGLFVFGRNSPWLPNNYLLLEASARGNTTLVSRLLVLGTNVNVRASKWNRHESPLHNAALAGHLDTIQVLLAWRANLEAKTEEGSTPLVYAALGGHTYVVAELTKRGAHVNAANVHGHTALILAAREGHTPVVQYLINAGADLNAADNNGATALKHARERGHYHIVQLFEDAGS